ncbi:MAG: Ig-like domain-containing protein [Candidatus Woesearchaeota archaeon]
MNKAIVFIGLFVILAALSYSEESIFTDKFEYQAGETVNIFIGANLSPALELDIIFSGQLFTFSSTNNSRYAFKPRTAGEYFVTLVNLSSNRSVAVISFKLLGQSLRWVRCTDHASYNIADRVLIAFNSSIIDLNLSVGDRTYQFAGDLEKPVMFRPLFPGAYLVQATDHTGESLFCNFSVSGNQSVVGPQILNNTHFVSPPRFKLHDSRKHELLVLNYSINSSEAVVLPLNSFAKKIVFHGLHNSTNLSLGLDEVSGSVPSPSGVRWKRVFAIDPSNLNFTSALVTLRAQGKALYKCREWDFSRQQCLGSWEKVKDITPGIDYNITLGPEDPGYAEAEINIINVQSYPQVGGTWTVMFTTVGSADLVITPINGTTWNGPGQDLMFMEIRCGESPLSFSWINNSVVVSNFSCNDTAYEVSKVLTSGKHLLEFSFGASKAYARNAAGDGYLIMLWDKATIPTNWTCISCTSTSPFYQRLPRGNSTYGAPSGSATHTHAVSLLSISYASSTVFGGETNTDATSTTHTHAVASQTSSSASSLPRYRNLKFIMYNYKVPKTLPAGIIGLFNSSPPAFWTLYSKEDGYFIMGENTTSTGGANSHNHTVSSFSLDATGDLAGRVWTNQAGDDARANHQHTVSPPTSQSASTMPPYIHVILANLSKDSPLPIGLIGMFNDTPSAYWSLLSSLGGKFSGKFIVGNSTAYGKTSSSQSHAHANYFFASGAATTNRLSRSSGTVVASDSHTHNVTLSFTNVTNLPPYINVIFSWSRAGWAYPNVTQITPAPDYVDSATSPTIQVNFTCRITDDYDAKNLSLYLTNNNNRSIKLNETCLIPSVNGSCSWIKGLRTGNYTWNCEGFDETGLGSFTKNRTVRLLWANSKPPIITITRPKNNTFSKNPVILNLTTDEDAVCRYSTTSTFSFAAGTLFSKTGTTIHGTNLGTLSNSTTYVYYVKCNDTVGNVNNVSNQAAVQFTVDNKPPRITLNIPVNGYNTTSEIVNFTWTTYDALDTNITCNLTLDSAVISASKYSPNNSKTSIVSSVTEKIHQWNVSCWDSAGNRNTSSTSIFTRRIIKAVLRVQTRNYTYKQNKAVNLTTRKVYDSGDLEPSTVLVTSYNRTGTVEYNFTSYSAKGHSAFYSDSAGSQPPASGPSINGEAVFTAAAYNALNKSDDSRADFGNVNDFRSHRFQFRINETSAIMTKLGFYYEGYDAGGDVYPLQFFLWDFSQQSWVYLGEHLSYTTDGIITATKSSSLASYVNSSHYLDIAVVTGNPGSAKTLYTDYVYVNVTKHDELDGDASSGFTNYSNVIAGNFTKLLDAYVRLQVTAYNASGSKNASNTYPDIEIQLYDGSKFGYSYRCNLTGSLGLSSKQPTNCSVHVVNSTIVTAWTNSSNRRVRVRAVNLDSTTKASDLISWNGFFVRLESPSELQNYGDLNLTGRLIIQVKNSTGRVLGVLYNQSIKVRYNSSLNFSGLPISWNTDSYPLGMYRVYAGLFNASNGMIRNYDGTFVNDTSPFVIDYLRITAQSPTNRSVVDATSFWANLTLSYLSYKSGGWCAYSMDNKPNVSMRNNSATHFFNRTSNISVGQHSIRFFCNDTQKDISSSLKIYFNGTDQTGPQVLLTSPANEAEETDGNVSFFYNVTDLVSGIKNCTLEFNFAPEATKTSIQEAKNLNFSMAEIPNGGPYYWRVYCYDNSPARNIGYSSYRSFIIGTDTDKPVVTLSDPVDGYNTSNNDLPLIYRVYDPTTGIKNCTLVLNNKKNETRTNIIQQGFPYKYNNFTLQNLGDGNYTWSVNCTDTSSAHNQGNSSTWRFTVNRDTDFPIVYLVLPADNYTSSSGAMDFYFNVTDFSSGIANCSLLINGTVNSTIDNVTEGILQHLYVPGFKDGSYVWQVNCTDDSYDTNTNTSAHLHFNVERLMNMRLIMTAFMAEYQKGSQLNETVNITALLYDLVGYPLSGMVDSDFIKANTSVKWWNSSWQRRKPIYLNNSVPYNKPNYLVEVNITGLSSFIRNCTKEIRIVDIHNIEVPSQVISGNDLTWCSVAFKANVSASAVNENRYFAYHNYTLATKPSYKTIALKGWRTYNFSNRAVFGHHAYNSNNPSDGGPQPPNIGPALNNEVEFTPQQYSDVQFSDNSRATSGTVNTERSHRFVFNISANASDADSITFVWEGYTTGSGPSVVLYLWNYSSSAWVQFGTHSITSDRNLSNSLNGTSLSSFVHNNLLHIAAVSDDPSNAQTLYTDFVQAKVLTNTVTNNSKVGSTEVFVARLANSTGSDGILKMNLSTDFMELGFFSVVGLASTSSYFNTTNHTHYTVAIDHTSPQVLLKKPIDLNISYVSDISLFFNVTDLLSGIKNCSLILNNKVNLTNTTVSEGSTIGFSLYNLANGDYNWTVNCTDDSSLQNRGTAAKRKFTIAKDTVAPIASLKNPSPGWTDANGNITLFFNVTDNLMPTADCTLYFNSSRNETKQGLQTGAHTHNFTLTGLNNGFYSWFVNCSDTSSQRNYASSQTWNFSVTIDFATPLIKLRFPHNATQLTNENITFAYNVTDALFNVSNCSLYLNGELDQTNITIKELANNTFRYFYMAGPYNWSVYCIDSSENANAVMSDIWEFLVAPDNDGPLVNPVFPPDSIELSEGNITFYYNVSDFASDVENCSLFINQTGMAFSSNIAEGIKQNLSVVLQNGSYYWIVNCTDNSENHNTGASAARKLTIGLDRTGPTVTLLSPVPPYNDTDGNVLLQYSVIDYASGVRNCSLFINDKVNATNSTIAESENLHFRLSTLSNGFYTWHMNCTDTSSLANTGKSLKWNFTVTLDNEGPAVNLVLPDDYATDTDGNRIFYYSVDDVISGIVNCSLVINNKLNLTNSSRIIENALSNFTITGLGTGQYNWSVNCTDNSDNHNRKGAQTRHLTVVVDATAPVVELISPSDLTADNDGNRTFYFNVTDSLTNVSSCTLHVGPYTYINTSLLQGLTQSFKLSAMSNGVYRWNISCVDSSENQNNGISGSRTLTVRIDLSPPLVTLKLPLNYTQSFSNDVVFTFNVTDVSPLKNCSLIANSTILASNSTIARNVTQDFALTVPSGSYLWSINCTDSSEHFLKSSSEKRVLVVGPDVIGPTVRLTNPPNNAQDTDGNVIFEFNASDFASALKNCSLILNGHLNRTKDNPPENTYLNFTVYNLGNGNYTWQVNCTDDSSNFNTAASEQRLLVVGVDQSPPAITLYSPANLSIYNSKDVVFAFMVYDYSSSVPNCSLILNSRFNQSKKPVVEQAPQYFYLQDLADGFYNWSVNCTDNMSNVGASSTWKVTVFRPRQLIADVYASAPSYELGLTAIIVANVTNSSKGSMNATVFSDIIRGNATSPWWSSSWKHRLPVDINSTNLTRKDSLVELAVNFTKLLKTDIGNLTVRFDANSVRVVEWASNQSKETVSQFDQGPSFNKSRNAIGTVRWIMNGTTQQNTIRKFYVYFDVEENGAKSQPNYAKPSFTFKGSGKSVLYDGASQSADRLTIRKSNSSFTLQFGSGQSNTNQQNVHFQGAGSIWNITVNRTRLTNYFDSIVPISIYNSYFINANSSSVVHSGAVLSAVNIPGYINASPGSKVNLNYSVWFTNDEIRLRANLVAQFSQANNNPASYFNNLWFAYMFDYLSSWNSFVHRLNSSTYGQTHNYHSPTTMQDTTNQFNAGRWYSEYWATVGSLNLYAEKFLLNGAANTVGVVTYDDYYNPAQGKLTESDAAGFNYNQDKAIAALDKYNLTVWLVFSRNGSYRRGSVLRSELTTPLLIRQRNPETLMKRQSGVTGSQGFISYQWATSGNSLGWYAATMLANKSLYYNGADYFPFQITQDITKPNVTLISPSGWINYSSVLFTYNVSESNPLVPNCSLIINGKLNKTNKTITNNARNYFRLSNLGNADYNWTVNCTDYAGNVASALTKKIMIDTVRPPLNISFPPQSALLSSTKVDFNFTVTDNRATNLTCELFVNSALRKTVVAFNNTRTNMTTNLSDGTYTWYVRCTDWASNRNTSSVRSLSVDTGPPTIQLISPAPGSYDNDGNFVLVYKPYDTGGLKNCSLIINNRLNRTNQSALKNNLNNNFTISGFGQAAYNWSINCTDIFGRVANSSTRTLYLDLFKPSISLLKPLPGSIFNISTVKFNFTVYDSFDWNLVCNLTVDSAVRSPNIAVSNGTIGSSSVSGLVDAVHYWNVSCWDHASNKNTSRTQNFTVRQPPIVRQLLPSNNSWSQNHNVTFYFNATDNDGIENCSLFFDNKLNLTKTVIVNRVKSNITLVDAPQGLHNWSIRCFDNSSLFNNASTPVWLVKIDYTLPNVSLISPATGTWNHSSTVSFSYSFVEANKDVCQLYANFSGSWKGNASNRTMISGQANKLTTTVRDGSYKWNVRCNDSAANIAFAGSNWTIRIDATPPSIRLKAPAMNYWDNNGLVVFNFSFTEKYPDKCQLWANFSSTWKMNQTINSPLPNVDNLFDQLNLPEGAYKWNVWCNDSAGNFAWNSTNQTLFVDKFSPHLLLISPLNGSNASAEVYFNFTVSDNVDSNLTCNLTLDNKVNRSRLNALSGSVTSVLVEGLKMGYHNWSVLCWDNALHYNQSATLWFNVSLSDLIALYTNLHFSDNTPEEGVNITVNATILNDGGTDAFNITVRFLERKPSGAFSQIDGLKIVNISVGANATLAVPWTPKIGLYYIRVAVDPANKIKEISESNNNATANITTSLWHTVRGNATGALSVSDTTNSSIYSWSVLNSSRSNVYVADSDSLILWTRLEPLTRNLSHHLRVVDIEYLDRGLGSANLTDSLNRTFVSQGSILATRNISVYNRLLLYVPVANSTNSSEFVTGILWDASDLDLGFYNGTQDVVFVTQVRAPTNSYGFGYELRIPAYLRSYKTNTLGTVTFYTELK